MTNEMNDDIQQLSELFDEVSEELLQSLNKFIAEKRIPPHLVLAMLARVAAGYTHQYQRTLTNPQDKDKVEEIFIENYNICLYDFDMHDVNEVMKQIRKEHLN